MRSTLIAPARQRQPTWFDVVMGIDSSAALEQLASLTRTARVTLHYTRQWHDLRGVPTP